MLKYKLKTLRLARQKSAREVAADLGMPYTTYLHWESGPNEPNTDGLVRLASYYGVSVDWLLDYDPDGVLPEASAEGSENLTKLFDTIRLLDAAEVDEVLRFTRYVIQCRSD